MKHDTANYGFLLQFSEPFINRLVNRIFALGIVPTRFTHDNATPPGLISTRRFPFGREAYKRYLMDALFGYDVAVYEPSVRLVPGPTDEIELSVGFSLSVLRELYVRCYDQAGGIEIPDDPATVDPDVDYPIVYETMPGADLYPSPAEPIKGRLRIRLFLGVRPFDRGYRVTVDCTTAGLDVIASVALYVADWDPGLVHFIETMAGKFITEVLRKEIKEIDVTGQIGVLDAFDLTIRPPVDIRIGEEPEQRVLSVAFNLSTQVGLGDREQIQVRTEGEDFALQLSEGFLAQLVGRIYDDFLPRRFSVTGKPDPAGPLLLYPPRIRLVDGLLQLNLLLEAGGIAQLFVNADLSIGDQANGEFAVRVERLAIHPRLRPYQISTLVNVVTFYVLDALISTALGSIFQGPVNSTLKQGVDAFLINGALAFSFDAPVGGAPDVTVRVDPGRFSFEPSVAVLRGNLSVVEGRVHA
jgi:hypothetical protein